MRVSRVSRTGFLRGLAETIPCRPRRAGGTGARRLGHVGSEWGAASTLSVAGEPTLNPPRDALIMGEADRAAWLPPPTPLRTGLVERV